MSQQAAIEEQLMAVTIEEMKGGNQPVWRPFTTGDTEVDGAVGAGAMQQMSTAEDRVIIFHRETGEPREILVNMLAKTLAKRVQDGPMKGQKAFSVERPAVEYVKGQVKCWLHPEHERRGEWDQIGLRGQICMSAHLATDFDAEQHMRNRHKRQFRTISEHETRRRDDEQRSWMKALMERQVGDTGPAPVAATHPCPEAGCPRFFDSAQGLNLHRTKERH